MFAQLLVDVEFRSLKSDKRLLVRRGRSVGPCTSVFLPTSRLTVDTGRLSLFAIVLIDSPRDISSRSSRVNLSLRGFRP